MQEVSAVAPVSALAAEASMLPARIRERLGIDDGVILMWDLLVEICAVLTDSGDARRWDEKLEEVMARRAPVLDGGQFELLVAQLQELAENESITGAAETIARKGFQQFLRRAVGAAAFHRVERALLADLAIVGRAMRAAATALMPYAQAVQDMLSVIPQARLGGLAPLVDPATGSLVGAVLQVDKALDSLVSSAVEGRIPEGVFSDLPPTVPADVAAQASRWREVISGRSWKQAERFGTLVTRKIQGAKDAIAMSADPVSQAATSLIELIDRLLREAYSDDQVMRWVVDNYAHEGNMTFLDGGRPRPTKRAQALCFVHAGQPRDDEPQVRELLADVIVSARTSLQGLKHADRGTPDELGTIEELMAALEGWFMVGVVLAWATLPEEVVNDLYDRIAPREPVVIPQEAPASIPA